MQDSSWGAITFGTRRVQAQTHWMRSIVRSFNLALRLCLPFLLRLRVHSIITFAQRDSTQNPIQLQLYWNTMSSLDRFVDRRSKPKVMLTPPSLTLPRQVVSHERKRNALWGAAEYVPHLYETSGPPAPKWNQSSLVGMGLKSKTLCIDVMCYVGFILRAYNQVISCPFLL